MDFISQNDTKNEDFFPKVIEAKVGQFAMEGEMSSNGKLARLRDLLWQMEVEVGLERLSQPQRDVYYAACLVADADKLLHSEQVRHHPMVETMARTSFYRALKDLVQEGYLVAASDRKNGRYKIAR